MYLFGPFRVSNDRFSGHLCPNSAPGLCPIMPSAPLLVTTLGGKILNPRIRRSYQGLSRVTHTRPKRALQTKALIGCSGYVDQSIGDNHKYTDEGAMLAEDLHRA